MYRIKFNPDTAKWQVQLLTWGIIWVTIKTNPLGFENFELASDYVQKVGLHNVYRDYHQSRTHNLLASGGAIQGAQWSR